MVNYKSKYLEMKLKYINAKNNLKGGMDISNWNSLNEKQKVATYVSLHEADDVNMSHGSYMFKQLTVTIYIDGQPYQVPRNKKLDRFSLNRLTGYHNVQIYEIQSEQMELYYKDQLTITPEELTKFQNEYFVPLYEWYGQKFVGFSDYPRHGLILNSVRGTGAWIRGLPVKGLHRSSRENGIIYGISDVEIDYEMVD